MRFPSNNGFLFNHVWGKFLRDGSSNLSAIRRHVDLSLHPVKAIEVYVTIFSVLSVDLSAGYLFLPLSSAGLKIFDSWNISFASAKPNVESRKLQNKVNCSFVFGSIRLLKFNQFGAFGTFNSSHVCVMPSGLNQSFWENLAPFLLTRKFIVTFYFHQFLIS